jgi:hypothetical protein
MEVELFIRHKKTASFGAVFGTTIFQTTITLSATSSQNISFRSTTVRVSHTSRLLLLVYLSIIYFFISASEILGLAPSWPATNAPIAQA